MIAHETNMFFLRYKATQITTNNSNRCVNVQQNKTKKKGGGACCGFICPSKIEINYNYTTTHLDCCLP